jgi:hypothetical protein
MNDNCISNPTDLYFSSEYYPVNIFMPQVQPNHNYSREVYCQGKKEDTLHHCSLKTELVCEIFTRQYEKRGNIYLLEN